MTGISRIDHEASRTHSWHVTVQRQKRIFTRHFSDHVHGGKQKALQAAKAYRDHLIARYPRLTRPEHCSIRKKNNRSGVSGVVRVDLWETRQGRRWRRVYWDAQWPIANGKARHKKFSVKKYGERGAYLRALAARRVALRALIS